MLYKYLMSELQTHNAEVVLAKAPAHRPEALAFLQRRGFVETNRMVHLELRVADACMADAAALADRLAPEEIHIQTLADAQAQDADWFARTVALIRAAAVGRVDSICAGSENAYATEEAAAHTVRHYLPISPEGFFIARRRDAYLGLSYLSIASDPLDQTSLPKCLRQGDTAVHPDWRRRGIATLLKYSTIEFAQRYGYDVLTTCTASPGMRAVNERLGYRETWSDVRLVRSFADPPAIFPAIDARIWRPADAGAWQNLIAALVHRYSVARAGHALGDRQRDGYRRGRRRALSHPGPGGVCGALSDGDRADPRRWQ